ncbi:MAG: sensor histidine kinase [Limisphaerales bacterium]
MITRSIIQIQVRSPADVVLVRQRAQAIAELAKFDSIKQTSFATAISEIARNAIQFANEGRVAFAIESYGNLHFLTASVIDQGPGIREVISKGGVWDRSIVFEGHGINSARKLVKQFSINCPPEGGTIVKLGLRFPPGFLVGTELVMHWSGKLSAQKPRNLLEEMHHRNQELVATLEALQVKEAELKRQVADDAVLKAALAESKHTLELRVQERTESLTLSNEELRAFSYTVSHDLRAPLRAINGFVHQLLDEHVPRENPSAIETSTRIFQAVNHMDELINALVAYTQVNKVPIPLKEVNLRELIEDLVKHFEPRLQPENVRVEIAGDFPAITANRAVLHNALLNLVENALKFRNPSREAYVRFRGAPDTQKLRLWVEDSGIGIAPEHHERIFGVFERLHGREIPGTGIGLAMVRRWIAGMQGSVGVESEVGQGARFWIDLPLGSSVSGSPSNDMAATIGNPQFSKADQE